MDRKSGKKDSNNSQPFMIGVAGPSCSGKTALVKQVIKELGKDNCSLIPLDSYYHDISHLSPDQIEVYNYDTPDAIEKELLFEHIRTISRGMEIEIPSYNYAVHTRSTEKLLIKPRKFILVEGLFALYWKEMRDTFDLNIFIDVPDSVGYERRIERDIRERGVTYEYVSNQYKTTVRPMYEQFVNPTKQYADVIVNGEDSVEKSVLTIMHQINKLKP